MVLETHAVVDIQGTFELPPSTDLFLLSATALIASGRTGSIGPIPHSDVMSKFFSDTAPNATYESAEALCVVRPHTTQDQDILLTDTENAYHDLMILMCVGAHLRVTTRELSAPKQVFLQSIAALVACTLTFSSSNNATTIRLDASDGFTFPQEDCTPETLPHCLALSFGLQKIISSTIDFSFVTPIRSLFEAFSYPFSVKSLNKPEINDPLERRIRLMQKKKKISDGPSFLVNGDFSQPLIPRAPAALTIPGDEVLLSLLVCAKSLIPRGSLVINNAPLESNLMATLDFVRKMGCRPGLQETHATSFGSCGMVQMQSFTLTGRKTSCSPLLHFKSQLPAMTIIAAFSQGQSVFRECSLFRTETPDRLSALVACLQEIETHHGEMPDGIVLEGSRQYDGYDIAPDYGAGINAACALGGMKCLGKTKCEGTSIQARYPGFFDTLFALCEYRNVKNNQQQLL